MDEVVETAAPSTGAETAAGDSGASSSPDFSLSDSEIFDNFRAGEDQAEETADAASEAKPGSDEETPTEEAPEGEDPAKKATEKPGEKTEEQTLEEEFGAEDLPKFRKEAFKKDPELRAAFYRDKAIRETHRSIDEIRKLTDTFHSPEEAAEALNAKETLSALGANFSGRNPNGPTVLLESLKATDEKSFSGMMAATVQNLHKWAPDVYSSFAGKVAGIERGNLRELIKSDPNIQRAIEDPEGALEAIDAYERVIATISGASPAMRQAAPLASRDQQELDRLRGERHQGQERQRQERLQTFNTEANNAVSALAKSRLDAAGATGLGALREKVEREIIQEGDRVLSANPFVKERVDQLLATKGPKEAAKFVAERFGLIADRIIRETIRPYTKQVVQQSAKTLAKSKEVASRREVSTQGRAPTGTPQKIDYRKMSDLDIFNTPGL